jgi:hypothetical protein
MIGTTFRRIAIAGICISNMILAVPSGAADVAPQKVPPYTEWTLVAAADVIAQGKLLTVKQSGSETAVGTFASNSLLKGKHDDPKIPIRQALKVDSQPTIETLKTFRGKPSVLFATKNSAEHSGTEDYSIVEKNGIQNLSEVDSKAIAAEVENEALINSSFAKLPIAQTDQFDHIISKLFLQLQSPATSEAAIAKLESFPEDVVPAIIRTMTLSPKLCKRRIHRAGTPEGTPGPMVETILFDICAAKTGMKLANQEGWRTWLFYTTPERPQ